MSSILLLRTIRLLEYYYYYTTMSSIILCCAPSLYTSIGIVRILIYTRSAHENVYSKNNVHNFSLTSVIVLHFPVPFLPPAGYTPSPHTYYAVLHVYLLIVYIYLLCPLGLFMFIIILPTHTLERAAHYRRRRSRYQHTSSVFTTALCWLRFPYI